MKFLVKKRQKMLDVIKINKSDNVVVALRTLEASSRIMVDGREIILNRRIEKGHKIACKKIEKGENVIKYGFAIGSAQNTIEPGEHVHTHNLRTGLGDNLEYVYNPVDYAGRIEAELTDAEKWFMGYERHDGRVGIRNEIWIVPTVGCVNSAAREIAERCSDYVCESIEAVKALNHPYGCSQLGDDQDNTRRILASLIAHPNAGGVLVLGLGCENSGIEAIKEALGSFDESRVRFLKSQDVENEIEEGIRLVGELALNAMKVKKTKQPIEKLVVGLKCGGSDGLSGITANPIVGGFSDLLIGEGGSTILTEVPEMFGAETILMSRAANEEVFNMTVEMINDFKDYFRKNGQVIYENPSPGNKAGGISTLEDKSLGCTQKSGCSKVVDVLKYGECVKTRGLTLLSAPGNDLVSTTAMVAAGANLILFTTGRGTPFGSPVPTIKISTGSELAKKKPNWIDFDGGRLLNEGESLDVLSRELLDLVLHIASGEMCRSEEAGYCDLAIFKQGVTL